MNERQRRSAKTVISDMVTEMMTRTTDPDLQVKLNVLQTVAAKMGWHDIFERLKNRYRVTPPPRAYEEKAEQPEPWWKK